MGPALKANLIRLGMVELTIPATRLAKEIGEKTGRAMSRQRIAALFNAVFIEQATIETLAKGLGVKPAELTRETGPKEMLKGLAKVIGESEDLPS